MIDDKTSPSAETVSRMLGWGRSLMVTGGVLLVLALGTRLTGSAGVGAALNAPLLWCGVSAAATGVLLTALGAVEQRLIETRSLLLTAIEHLKADRAAEAGFRSRPASNPRLRASQRLR